MKTGDKVIRKVAAAHINGYVAERQTLTQVQTALEVELRRIKERIVVLEANITAEKASVAEETKQP